MCEMDGGGGAEGAAVHLVASLPEGGGCGPVWWFWHGRTHISYVQDGETRTCFKRKCSKKKKSPEFIKTQINLILFSFFYSSLQKAKAVHFVVANRLKH